MSPRAMLPSSLASAGAVFLDDFGASGVAEFPDLACAILVVGGNAGVFDQGAGVGFELGGFPCF